MSECSFLPTSYAPSATALLAEVTVIATKPTLRPNGNGFQGNQGQAQAQSGVQNSSTKQSHTSLASLLTSILLGLYYTF